MNIIINYDINDYKADAVRSIKIKINIQQKIYYSLHAVIIIILIILVKSGLQANHARYYFSGSVYFGISIAIFLLEILTLWTNISERKKLRKRIITHINDKFMDIRFSFTNELLTYRADKIYIEYHWDYFRGYLMTEEFLFFVIDGLENSVFVALYKFNNEEIFELKTFLAANLKVWKK